MSDAEINAVVSAARAASPRTSHVDHKTAELLFYQKRNDASARGRHGSADSGGRARIKHVAKGMAYEPGSARERRDL
jgi:hypothetical protein